MTKRPPPPRSDRNAIRLSGCECSQDAGEIGIRENDVIVSINRQPVAGIDDIKKIQSGLKGGDAVAFRVMRPNPFAGRTANAGPRFASMFLSGTLPK